MGIHEDDRWFAYECVLCSVVGQGIVLEMRAPVPSALVDNEDEHGAWKVKCPLCTRPMVFKGQWVADEDGYGSRGDSAPHAVNIVRAATALERHQCAQQCKAVAERYEDQAESRVAAECASAIEGRI